MILETDLRCAHEYVHPHACAAYSREGGTGQHPPLARSKWDEERELLYGVCNVRLYNITGDDEKEFLMDTIGLHKLGLPDIQIRLSGYRENEVADLLWNYAYYIFEQGEIIENGNTLEGITTVSKWTCERSVSLVAPEMVVLNVLESAN